MTRRDLLLAAAPATLLAHTPQPPPLPQSPSEELTAARDAQRSNADQMAKVKLPMPTEPAVHFKA